MVSDGQPTGPGPNRALTGVDMHHLSRSEHFRKYSTYQRAHLRFSEVSEHQDLGASHPSLALGLGLARTSHPPRRRRRPLDNVLPGSLDHQ